MRNLSIACVSIYLLGCASAFRQLFGDRINFGVKGGIMVSNGPQFGSDENKRYTVGPVIEYRFADHFSAEF